MDIFRTLIVPSDWVELARAIGASFGPGGEGMWITPLSDDGLVPATHYISSGFIKPDFAALVPFQVWTQDQDGDWVLALSEPGDPVAAYEAVIASGYECTQDDVDTLFDLFDVTDQEPFVAMGRMGIKLIQPPMEG